MNTCDREASERSDPADSFVRWQAIMLAQMTYVLDLILGIAIAVLGFQVALLRSDGFSPVSIQKCVFSISLFLTCVSIAAGVAVVINRLWDFRMTTRAARSREKKKPAYDIEPLRVEYRKLGHRTWSLFYWQIGTLSLAMALLVTCVLMMDGHKLL